MMLDDNMFSLVMVDQVHNEGNVVLLINEANNL
jgi:hypothetical protein